MADVGSWKRGQNIDLPGVTNLNEALKKAHEIMDGMDLSGGQVNGTVRYVPAEE